MFTQSYVYFIKSLHGFNKLKISNKIYKSINNFRIWFALKLSKYVQYTIHIENSLTTSVPHKLFQCGFILFLYFFLFLYFRTNKIQQFISIGINYTKTINMCEQCNWNSARCSQQPVTATTKPICFNCIFSTKSSQISLFFSYSWF